MKLKGKIAIVTGAGRGIGRSTAIALAKQGAKLVLVARTVPELERAAEEIADLGGEAQVLAADVADAAAVDGIAAATVAGHGRIDILVNAAGTYGPIGRLWEIDRNEWLRGVAVNLHGTFLCCHAVLPHMVKRRAGCVINFSGGGATAPLPRFSAYGASKAAVVRLTETLAEECREFNVRVNAIAPGAVDTSLQDAVLAAGTRAGDLLERIQQLRESGVGGVPPELAAELAVFLASEDSRGLTGKLIAAPYDGWQTWDAERIDELNASPWFTLRRLDRFTLDPLTSK